MTRDFRINGETMIKVKGGQHMSGRAIANLAELGLTTGPVVITPTFMHYDKRVDDFGPDVPADVLWNLADVRIRATLIHYDADVLDTCIKESMGGGLPGFFNEAGLCGPAGTPLGKGKALFASGNNLISVNLLSPQLNNPWRFPACYLTGPPIELPLGTQASAVLINWRAIPYKPLVSGGISSSGAPLWYRNLDS